MKIIVVCGAAYVSGKEKIMLGLLVQFKKMGHEVFCVVSKWNDKVFISLLKENDISYQEVYIGFLSVVLQWKVIRMVADQLIHVPNLYVNFKRILKREKPDIIIHTNFHTTFSLFPLLNKKSIHIYHSHESIINSKFYQRLFKLFNTKFSHFVGVSDFVSNRLKEIGVPSKKISTIYNGIIICDQSNTYKRTNQSNRVTIGIVGQIGEWKGHDDLFGALGILSSKGIDFECLIFGSSNVLYKTLLSLKAEALHIKDKIFWMGYEVKQEKLYDKLDIVCVPSRFEEPFGLAALEPALYGIPVIATTRGGLPEIVRDSQTGFLIPAHAPQQLADKLEILVKDKCLRERMGAQAYSSIVINFDIILIGRKWEALFKKCLTD